LKYRREAPPNLPYGEEKERKKPLPTSPKERGKEREIKRKMLIKNNCCK
jgi:hypothetical protein